MAEGFYQKQEREASERLEKMLALRLPDFREEMGCDDVFDPWNLFPSLYGSYSGDFDRCAIEVLEEINTKTKVRDDLGAEMFREMLCTAGFCNYGTSPRVCFSNERFEASLPKLIEKWRAYSLIQWDGDVCAD